MELIVIEKKDWLELTERLDRIEKCLDRLNLSEKISQRKDWMPLNEFLKYSTISRASWYREYQYKIKYRNDGIKIWVNWPSYEHYLEEKAVNKRAA